MAKGLSFEAAQAGEPLTAAQKSEFDAAISRLEAIEKVRVRAKVRVRVKVRVKVRVRVSLP